jgi:hypothetical protein
VSERRITVYAAIAANVAIATVTAGGQGARPLL